MPQVAAWATAALAVAITGGATTAAAGAAATAVAATIVSVATQALVAAATTALAVALTPKQRAEGSATAFRADTDAGIPIAYGRVGVSGLINYRVAYDATNRYQTLFCTVSAGPIKSFVSFAADDEVTTFDGTTNKAVDGQHAGAMWLKTALGAQPQTALTSPTGAGAGIAAPDWGSNHKLNGLACYALTMVENSKLSEYKGGVVKPLHVIEGVYGWDPRLDSTYPGGSGSCRLLTPSTWVWIDEGAIAALNWAIGRWAGDSGGGTYGVPYACSLIAGIGSSLDGIDVASFVNAANVADANGWKVCAYPSTKDDKFTVLANLLQASGAVPSRKAGKISCITHGESQASVVSVTAADTAGPVEVSLGQSRLERFNTVLPRFWSEDHRWEMVQIAPITNSAWTTEDGGKKRTRGIDYPTTPTANQAAQLAYYDIANTREPITGTVSFKPHMRRIEPGDCLTFNEPGLLLSGVKVKCLTRSYDPMSGGVRITFRQETDAKHAAALAKTGTAPGDSDPVTPPAAPSAPTITSVTDVYDTSGLIVTASLSVLANGPTEDGLDWSLRWRVASGAWVESLHTDQLTDPTLQSGLVPLGETLDVQVAYFVAGVRTAWSATTTIAIDESDVIIDGNDP
jgi:hypothetical protein